MNESARSSLWVIAMVGAVACTDSETQILVLVNSDLSVRDELTSIRALIRDTDDQTLRSHTFDLAQAETTRQGHQHVLPISFGVLPETVIRISRW